MINPLKSNRDLAISADLWKKLLAGSGISASARAEEISLASFADLANAVSFHVQSASL